MTSLARRQVVVVSGPIASGKSTLATELADLLRSAGEAVAVVGLDSIAEMALPTLDDWTWAHDIQGQVVGGWLATAIPTVIAEGPATQTEVEQVLRHVPSDVTVFKVLLMTRYETALRRAIADPTRGISKDPDFLGKMYGRFNDDLPGMAYDLRLDSEELSPGVLAARVVTVLNTGRTVSG
jgi:energy-coupling factor transporter ATP-binding protein EcfA2